jgi:hypothetical protein
MQMINSFTINLQASLVKAMQKKKIGINDLAKKLNLGEYEANLLFDPDCNIDVRTLGKILDILGLQIRLVNKK